MVNAQEVLERFRTIALGVTAREAEAVDREYRWPEATMNAIKEEGLAGLVVILIASLATSDAIRVAATGIANGSCVGAASVRARRSSCCTRPPTATRNSFPTPSRSTSNGPRTSTWRSVSGRISASGTRWRASSCG